jgi:hypothetical protein
MTQTLTPVKPAKLIINGEHVDAASGETFTTINPATEEPITEVAKAGAEDVNRAVKAARTAFDSGPWPKMKPAERQKILWRLGDLILEHGDELGRLETLDNGKPIFESRQIDVPMVANCFHYFRGLGHQARGRARCRRPVVLHLHAARAAGRGGRDHPVELSDDHGGLEGGARARRRQHGGAEARELTPLTAIRIGELALEAGLPPGVLNIVSGPGAVAGEALVRDPRVDKISFTGSTEVGKHLMRTAADTVKKLTLELGGKSPNIVFADADLDAAVRGASTGIFYGKGEVCAAGSRLLVEKSVHDEFVAKLAERAKKIAPADPLDPKTRLGSTREQRTDGEGAGLRTDRRARRCQAGRGRRAPAGERARVLRSGHGAGRRRQPDEGGAGGDLRTGARGDRVRRRGGRGREGERRPVRPRRRRVDARREEGHSVARRLRPARCGSMRTISTTPRFRSEATRPRASGATSAPIACATTRR